jgi:hypothetical protein
MKFERTEVFNMENAIRGMRNPLESWGKSDSELVVPNGLLIGEADMDLAKRLINGGSEHRKFLRQIIISVDITAPIYWWKEFDTYKVGTVANSTSTMHRLAKDPISWDMFEFGGLLDDIFEDDVNKGAVVRIWKDTIADLENLRKLYEVTGNKFYWKELVRLLPQGWLQTRTVTMSYENALAMYGHRHNHKLTEWHDFCDWIHTLPYAADLFSIG